MEHKTTDALPIGYALHWYEIKSVLSKSRFAITYLANDMYLDRSVAIKEYFPVEFAERVKESVVNPIHNKSGKMYKWGLMSFEKETRLLAKISHANIARVLNGFAKNNTAYMVMEYEHGETLSELLEKNKKFNQQELLDIVLPILNGLALVHKNGLLHRDIKPNNIFIRENASPVLMDFGSSRLTLNEKTNKLTYLVTSGYSPFEQYKENRNSHGPWTDIYSLGATLYKCISGKKPEDAIPRGTNLILNNIDTYISIAKKTSTVFDAEFLDAIDMAMNFYAHQRPQSVEEWTKILTGEEKVPIRSQVKFKHSEQKELSKTLSMLPDSIVDTLSTTKKDRDDLESITRIKSGVFNKTNTKRGAQTNKKSRNVHTKANAKLRVSIIAIASAACIMLVFAFSDFSELLPSNQMNVEKQPEQIIALDSASKISIHLAIALQKSSEKEYATPENDSALYHFKQVLDIDPKNNEAESGLNTVLKELKKQAHLHLKEKEYSKVQKKIDIINQYSLSIPDTLDIQVELELALSRQSNIDQLLEKADSQFRNNKIIWPKNNNAVATYRQILKQDPRNKKAFTGLQTIVMYFSDNIEKNLKAGKPILASKDLNKLKQINSSDASIPQIEERIKLEFKKQFEDHIAYARFNNAKKIIHRIKILDPNSPLIEQMESSLRIMQKSNRLNVGELSQ